ncbi:histone-lysine N-methyltransferase SETMAR [Trichonephila clavipes]|nr:histone-lysine N-methyltransferase SETMAR [Trichonephila clavipes]
MLLEFHKGSNATVATKNICDVYPSALDVRKCRRRLSKFRSGNFDLSDSYRSGRPTALDNDVINGASGSKWVSDNRGTVKPLNQPCRPSRNICNRLVKQTEQVLGFHIISMKKIRANRSTTCTLLLQRYNTEPFFYRLIIADEK